MTRFPGGPADSTGFLFWYVTLRWQRAIASALAPLELTHVQFVLLATTWWLNEQDQIPNQLTLASQAGTDVKMTSQVLRRLEQRGLLERHIDSHDTRAKTLRITQQGAGLAQEAIAVVEQVDECFFSATNSTQLTQALKELARPAEPANTAEAKSSRPHDVTPK